MSELLGNKLLFWVVVIGSFARVTLSFLGQNTDVLSYEIVGDIVLQGKNVYVETARYNYAPMWFVFLGFAKYIANLFPNSLVALHVVVVCMLTAADIGLLIIIWKKFGILPATLFFLNPISIIITGFHSQFDNISILIAWVAVLYLANNKTYVKGIFLLALSLIVKHSFIFFVVWLFFHDDNKPFFKNLTRRILAICVPCLLFAVSFLPFAFNGGWVGIWANVFNYQSFSNSPFWFYIAPVFVKESITTHQLFVVMMVVFAFIFRKVSLEKKFLLYLFLLPLTASAMANQYLIYPLIPAIIFLNPFFLGYIVFTSIYLFVDRIELNQQKLVFLLPNRMNPNIDMWRSYDLLFVFIFIGLLYLVWQKYENCKDKFRTMQ